METNSRSKVRIEEEETLLEDGADNEVEMETLDQTGNAVGKAEEAPAAAGGFRSYLTPGCQLYFTALLCGAAMKATSKLLMEKIDMQVLIFTRMGITLVMTVVYMWFKGIEHFVWGPPGVRLLVLFRGILGTVNIFLTMFALMYLSLPEQTVLSFLGPQTTAILAWLVLHEAYYWQQALWGLVSLSGVVFIAKPAPLFSSEQTGSPATAAHRLQAVIASLLVVASASAVMVTVRKIGTRAHPLCVVGSYSMFSVLASASWMIIARSPLALPKNLSTWILLLGTGFFGFFLQLLSSMALQREEASHLASFRYTQILWAVIFELIIWHDLPDLWTVLGATLVAIGVVQTTLVRHRLKEAEKAAT